MKKIIAISLVIIIILSFTACSKEYPVIGTWENFDGTFRWVVTIYANGFAKREVYDKGDNTQPTHRYNYEWTYNDDMLKLENKQHERYYFYNAATDTLKCSTGEIYKRTK
jgi:hypothetical protein